MAGDLLTHWLIPPRYCKTVDKPEKSRCIKLMIFFFHCIIVANGPSSSSLRYVALPFTQCPSQSTSNMVCVGGIDIGQSACSGDSGGPLVVPRSQSDYTAVVVGITSHRYGDCGKLPEAFASVTAQLDWIKTSSGVA